MFKFISILTVLTTALILSNCQDNKLPDINIQEKSIQNIGEALAYNLDSPVNEFTLSRDLKEISGLTYSPVTEKLLTINDEKGIIYLLNPDNGEIQEKFRFGRANDYEGIAYRNGKIYVVESNGDIVVVDEESRKKIDSHKSRLSRKNDLEGLTYNPTTATFLIAAKGTGSIKGKNGKHKAIFTFDSDNGTVSEIPFIKVNLKESIKMLSTNPKGNAITNYQMMRIGKFSPSGIAVHPISNDIYVLSSRGKLLTIFAQNGNLKGVHFLKEGQHSQPEGICFGPNNTMYISNEGRAGKASLFSFTYKNK